MNLDILNIDRRYNLLIKNYENKSQSPMEWNYEDVKT